MAATLSDLRQHERLRSIDPSQIRGGNDDQRSSGVSWWLGAVTSNLDEAARRDQADVPDLAAARGSKAAWSSKFRKSNMAVAVEKPRSVRLRLLEVRRGAGGRARGGASSSIDGEGRPDWWWQSADSDLASVVVDELRLLTVVAGSRREGRSGGSKL
ncbi:hypothetical protein M6B38_274040 [Iris pallida]|uniref:Uncharacterized protein n=1 Tax=Iris pallida TaxID=29817 RepID=A0AAX6I637_IRIPA|nr:hypothetical protein M6B38_274040 [Iris pallida]